MKRFFLLFIVIGATTVLSLKAQTVMTVDAEIDEFDLIVTYSVAGLGTDQLFDVELYSSKDNFSVPLTGDDIQGAVGSRIAIESTNTIRITNPLEVLEGVSNINFKVKVELVFNPVTLREPTGSNIFQKKKKPMTVLWRGGLKNEPITFDLYRYDEMVIDDFYKANNNGTAEFKMPNVDKGEGYTMKMEFSSIETPIELPPLTVKPKKSVAARVINIALLLVAADAALYFAADSGVLFKSILGEEETPIDVGVTELPDAPDPPQSRRAGLTIPLFR